MKNKKIIIFLIILSSIITGVFAESMTKYGFYLALDELETDIVKKYLEAGYDPNKCRGEAMWVDSNPLRVVSEQWFSAYDFRKQDMKKIDSLPDVDIIYLLIQYGANINKLPYIWNKVWRMNNKRIERILKNEEDKNKKTQIIVEDCNRVLKALLDNGADPNMKGHPFPFGDSKKLLLFTDKKAFKYFNSEEATTPLYEAIKKGMTWESQVDLLLEYGAKLDSSCLIAAKLSGEQAMIDKIENLMKEMNK